MINATSTTEVVLQQLLNIGKYLYAPTIRIMRYLANQ